MELHHLLNYFPAVPTCSVLEISSIEGRHLSGSDITDFHKNKSKSAWDTQTLYINKFHFLRKSTNLNHSSIVSHKPISISPDLNGNSRYSAGPLDNPSLPSSTTSMILEKHFQSPSIGFEVEFLPLHQLSASAELRQRSKWLRASLESGGDITSDIKGENDTFDAIFVVEEVSGAISEPLDSFASLTIDTIDIDENDSRISSGSE
jgi:hypothetical protein